MYCRDNGFSVVYFSYLIVFYNGCETTYSWLSVHVSDFRVVRRRYLPSSADTCCNLLLETNWAEGVTIRGRHFLRRRGQHSPSDFLHLDAVWSRVLFWGTDRLAVASLILCSVFRSRAQLPTSLPPPCPACLPISHPLWLSVCVYVYHNYHALQPPTQRPCSPAPPIAQHAPNPDMARFLISSFLPPGSERDRITNSVLSLPSLQPPLPSLTVYGLCFAMYQPAACSSCWPQHVTSILPLPSLGLFLSRLLGWPTSHHPFTDLSIVPH